MRDRKVELQVGLVVVLAVIIFAWGIIWLKEYKFRQERYTYSVLFPNVGALEIGDPVAVLGVAKGGVEKMVLYQGEVLVTFNLTSDVILKEDATFTVKNIGLMGERYIEVEPGHSQILLDLSELQKGFFDSGIPEVMGMMGEMITEIRRLTSHFQGTFGTAWAEESIKKSIENMRRLSEDLSSLLAQNKKKISKTVNDLHYASSELKKMVDDNKEKLNSTVDNFASASERFKNITEVLDSLSFSLKILSEKIEKGEGTLGKLINDKSLYEELKNTTKSVDELVKDIKKNPKRYFKFELF